MYNINDLEYWEGDDTEYIEPEDENDIYERERDLQLQAECERDEQNA